MQRNQFVRVMLEGRGSSVLQYVLRAQQNLREKVDVKVFAARPVTDTRGGRTPCTPFALPPGFPTTQKWVLRFLCEKLSRVLYPNQPLYEKN